MTGTPTPPLKIVRRAGGWVAIQTKQPPADAAPVSAAVQPPPAAHEAARRAQARAYLRGARAARNYENYDAVGRIEWRPPGRNRD